MPAAYLSLPYLQSSDASEVKSLDLLAALPTPPHNQTEDVRWEEVKNKGGGQDALFSFWPIGHFKEGHVIYLPLNVCLGRVVCKVQ